MLHSHIIHGIQIEEIIQMSNHWWMHKKRVVYAYNGIFSLTKAVANQGFLYVLNLIGMLSVNIGLMNLLPIPALDGGRLVFVAYEAITKKKPNQKVETALITVTMILLFGLMIFITFNDILRLFK